MNETFTNGMWAILELMGHTKLAGFVSEETAFGVQLGRIDIPGSDGAMFTQYFGGGSVYRITPCQEEIARAFAAANRPRPIRPWELMLPKLEEPTDEWDGEDIDDDF